MSPPRNVSICVQINLYTNQHVHWSCPRDGSSHGHGSIAPPRGTGAPPRRSRRTAHGGTGAPPTAEPAHHLRRNRRTTHGRVVAPPTAEPAHHPRRSRRTVREGTVPSQDASARLRVDALVEEHPVCTASDLRQGARAGSRNRGRQQGAGTEAGRRRQRAAARRRQAAGRRPQAAAGASRQAGGGRRRQAAAGSRRQRSWQGRTRAPGAGVRVPARSASDGRVTASRRVSP